MISNIIFINDWKLDQQELVKERKDGALKKISSGVDKFLEELSKIGKLLTYNQLFGWFCIKSCMDKACLYRFFRVFFEGMWFLIERTSLEKTWFFYVKIPKKHSEWATFYIIKPLINNHV